MIASQPVPGEETKSKAIKRLNGIYDNGDHTASLTDLGKKLNLKEDSPVWTQIADAIENRQKEAPKAIAAIHGLEPFPDASNALGHKMQALQGKFIAMFAAQRIKAAVYHFYGHGKEMSNDPGHFAATMLPKTAVGDLMKDTVNALGAAHDIVQGKGPPTNEKESAAIFVQETKQAITELLAEVKLPPAEVAALENYRDNAVKFLADECITNATYLLFQSGKRDFDNVLSQVESACAAAPGQKIQDGSVGAMKLAVALSDTRRSEMYEVLKKQEMFFDAYQGNATGLEKLLKAAGVIAPDDNLAELKKLAESSQSQWQNTFNPASLNATEKKLVEIEGFLLRVGQNVRMTAELAVAFAKPEDVEAKQARQQLIGELRQNAAVTVDLENHLKPFLNAIPGGFGESAFAKDLGTIDQTEILPQATANGLSAIANDKTLDLQGWARHADQLMTLKQNFDRGPEDKQALTQEDKQAIANALFTCAAKPPGHHVGQDTYHAMVKYENELFIQDPNAAQLANLTHVINEIEAAHPETIARLERRTGAEEEFTINADVSLHDVSAVFVAKKDYAPPLNVEPLSLAAQQRIEGTHQVDNQADDSHKITATGPGRRL